MQHIKIESDYITAIDPKIGEPVVKVVHAKTKELYEKSCILHYDLGMNNVNMDVITEIHIEDMTSVTEVQFGQFTDEYQKLDMTLCSNSLNSTLIPLFKESPRSVYFNPNLSYILKITFNKRVTMRNNPLIVIGRRVNQQDRNILKKYPYNTKLQIS